VLRFYLRGEYPWAPKNATASGGADKESNWLPAPAGKFIRMLRLYWPNESDPSIIDGSWKIPGVTRAS